MFLYLVLIVVVVGAVAEGCKRLCQAKNGGGSPVATGMDLVDLDADTGEETLDADAGGVRLDADAGGVTHRVDGDPSTAPVDNAGAGEDDGAGGVVKEEGEIRCACSGHGSGGCVTFAEVSCKLGWGRGRGGSFHVAVFG